LRAAITETVNVLSKGGEIQRVMITGEIALSYRKDPTSVNEIDPLRIRIANFEQFEKAAPNSAYLSQIADAPGEYTILPSLLNNNSSAHATTVLKYQLHVAAGSERQFVPLHVKALWKCEAGQTRIIVSYSGNPTARLAEREQSPFGGEEDDDEASRVRLEDVSFGVPMSTVVTNYQAKPSAEWSADKARLTFNVEPIVLGGSGGSGTGGEEKKLLAMMSTDGTASPQPVAVKWRAVGATVSRVGVDLVSSSSLALAEVVRTSIAGKYLVAP
jgi:hypothetical protein